MEAVPDPPDLPAGGPAAVAPGLRGDRARRPGPGFSFLHVLGLLLGLGLVAAIVIPAWFAQPRVTLDNAVRLLAQDLREAQNRAAFTHSSIEVRFLPEGDGYELVHADGTPLRAKLGSGPYRRQYSRDAVFAGVRIEELDTRGSDALRFDELGFVEQRARIVLSFGAARRELRVEERTGLVTIDGLDEPWTDDGD